MKTVYFDNAATSFPKPACVINELDKCVRKYCGNPGRSSHRLALAASNKIYECRERLSALFGSGNPENVIFTLNTTYALNLAIKGLASPGDHILISDMEHNSVLRPVVSFCLKTASHGTKYDVFPTVKDGAVLPDAEILSGIASRFIKGKTKLLICSHVPNVVSSVRPIRLIGEFCRKNGIIFILDAAQSAGHVPIDIKKDAVSVICVPGHKGLYGIQGSGAMILNDGVLPRGLFEGGNGVNSLGTGMSEILPERYEPGTLPTPAIAALSEGLGFIFSVGLCEIQDREHRLYSRLCDMLSSLGAEIYLRDCPGAVLLFNLPGHAPEAVGRALARDGICVRCGYHCSLLGHRTLGTSVGGAVRASFGYFNSEKDTDLLYGSLRSFLRSD